MIRVFLTLIILQKSVTENDVNSLAPITPGQELPLVFFLKNDSADLVYPLGLFQVEIENGRIWSSETKFYATPSAVHQIFFCPHSDATQECLVIKMFGQSEVLQCNTELKPITYENRVSAAKGCGPEEKGKLLSFGYKMKPTYKLQYLIPPENMAFAAWKKATYHYANQAPLHETLFELWNDINMYIRNDAIKWSGVPRNIITGIAKIPEDQIPAPKLESNMYDIWITVVMELDETVPFKAVVILMNNFISNIDNQTASSSSFTWSFIDRLCGNTRSFCVESLKRKFARVGGEIRCCKLTAPIVKQFSINGLFTLMLPDTLMKIENITIRPPVRV